MRRLGCTFCGNAYTECSCEARGKEIARRLMSSDHAEMKHAFRDYRALQGRFRIEVWGDWMVGALRARGQR